MNRHEQLTQKFSTWGDKLLQHTDVLYRMQYIRKLQPITVQLAPCEVCDSDCAFCSVAERPLRSSMPWEQLKQCLLDFKKLGAKALEITGGGNPLLYRDRTCNRNFNAIVAFARAIGYKIGVITNAHDLSVIDKRLHDSIDWIRISLIKLDEGVNPEGYNFNGFPEERIGFSYIIYDGVIATPRLHRSRHGTDTNSIRNIIRLVELHPKIKFVRIAGDCLKKGANVQVREVWRPIIDEIDKHEKFFVKDIGENDDAFGPGCFVGALRPYIAPSPDGGDYRVYICTSHVLNSRNYDLAYSLGSIENVKNIWEKMNERYRTVGYPYSVKCNQGKDWDQTCKFCYYANNNKLLYNAANRSEDWEFA